MFFLKINSVIIFKYANQPNIIYSIANEKFVCISRFAKFIQVFIISYVLPVTLG